MITIQVMYADLSIVGVPSEDIDNLKKDDVLFILFKNDGKNIISLSKFDYYGIKIEQDNIKYVQFNNEDGCIHAQYFDGTRKRTFRNKMSKGFTEFEGGYVDMSTWKKALEKFEKEMQ